MSFIDNIQRAFEHKGAGRKKVQVTLAANGTIVVPARYKIDEITMRNTIAAAVTGGIRAGVTDGGATVILAQAVGSSAILEVKDAAILLNYFSHTLPTTIYLQAVTAWNTAVVQITVFMSRV